MFPLKSAILFSSVLCLALIGVPDFLQGDSVILNPVADTTLFQHNPDNNLGSEPTFVSGSTASLLTNRALLKFDISGSVPPNATIESVSLVLTVTRTMAFDASLFRLHRVLRDWGEGTGISPDSGTSGGNIGAAALNGEATWFARFYPDGLWSAPGAAPPDFLPDASATQTISGEGAYTFSSSELIADVQNWVTNAANFGWMLICDDELSPGSARRFASREDPANSPTLFIRFTQPSRPRVTLRPIVDTSLFELNPDFNLGSASLVSGAIGAARGGLRSRALLQFSMDDIPADAAIITSATLNLTVVKVSGNGIESNFDLHRVLRPWGEGHGSQVIGDPAMQGEATWNARFFRSDLWSVPGAAAPVDFLSAASSTTLVSGYGSYSFPNLLSDVEFWLAHPGQNYGWILISQSESVPYTARRFGSREDLANSPTLDLEYIPRPRIEQSKLLGNQFNLSFLAQADQPYAVEYRDSLSDGGWVTLTNLPPLSFIQTVTVAAAVTGTQRFYRIILR